jgi:thiol-disulfide isomerase/thioredoxin
LRIRRIRSPFIPTPVPSAEPTRRKASACSKRRNRSPRTSSGKVVLINLWATWCGPCNAELPQLQKLYDQAKGRPDLQILTFNIDEDLGLVEPFMKERGYTFPVVPAYSYVVNLLNGYAIPQNWVLSPKGDWEWTQVGYGSDDAWVKDMLAKLDAVKAGG